MLIEWKPDNFTLLLDLANAYGSVHRSQLKKVIKAHMYTYAILALYYYLIYTVANVATTCGKAPAEVFMGVLQGGSMGISWINK